MRAKLIKVEDVYRLLREDNLIIGTTDYEYQKAFSDHCYKLSLKNCEAIERGYDLDKLADEYCTHEPKNAKELRDVNIVKLGFRDGFQKALEILGDKKFNEEDVMLGWDAGVMSQAICFSNYFGLKREDELKKHRESYQRDLKPSSLQQTEWDVEIEMECPKTGCDIECDIDCYEPNKKPKLDSDGCLILKRI